MTLEEMYEEFYSVAEDHVLDFVGSIVAFSLAFNVSIEQARDIALLVATDALTEMEQEGTITEMERLNALLKDMFNSSDKE